MTLSWKTCQTVLQKKADFTHWMGGSLVFALLWFRYLYLILVSNTIPKWQLQTLLPQVSQSFKSDASTSNMDGSPARPHNPTAVQNIDGGSTTIKKKLWSGFRRSSGTRLFIFPQEITAKSPQAISQQSATLVLEGKPYSHNLPSTSTAPSKGHDQSCLDLACPAPGTVQTLHSEPQSAYSKESGGSFTRITGAFRKGKRREKSVSTVLHPPDAQPTDLDAVARSQRPMLSNTGLSKSLKKKAKRLVLPFSGRGGEEENT